MLSIYVVDQTAEQRFETARFLESLMRDDVSGGEFAPRISWRWVAPDELEFHASPDLFFFGRSVVEQAAHCIARTRQRHESSAIVVRVAAATVDLAMTEDLARLGVDEAVHERSDGAEFMRRVLLMTRRRSRMRSGRLILVESGKGGVGATSVAAAIAEAGAFAKKRTLLIDGDLESQDLSRFIGIRPCVNEALSLILDGARPLNQETLSLCMAQVWDDDTHLYCMPPCLPGSAHAIQEANTLRTFISILELLDQMFDLVVVDVASMNGRMLRALRRASDHVVVITAPDPAAIVATIGRIRAIRAESSVDARLTVVDNIAQSRRPLRHGFLLSEIQRASGLSTDSFFTRTIPFCAQGSTWAGSGLTLYSGGSLRMRRVFSELLSWCRVLPVERYDVIGSWYECLVAGLRRCLHKERHRADSPAVAASAGSATLIRTPRHAIAELPDHSPAARRPVLAALSNLTEPFRETAARAVDLS